MIPHADDPEQAAPVLVPHHLVQLVNGLGISRDVIAERRYSSVLPPGGHFLLKGYGFTPVQAKHVPGLLLPLWTTDGQQPLMVYRPDTARKGVKDREIKYELPKNAGVRLDCPPRCQPQLQDPSTRLWVVEGQKKADALASHSLCAIALLGVWNFKGKNFFGGVTFSNDWDYIALKGREIVIAYDSDLRTKPPVRQALGRLTEHLQRKGARVAAVYLPAEDGKKIGVDDYLLTHTVRDLEGLIEAPRPQPQPAQPIVELLLSPRKSSLGCSPGLTGMPMPPPGYRSRSQARSTSIARGKSSTHRIPRWCTSDRCSSCGMMASYSASLSIQR
jgi:hypothetical protein